MNSSIATPRSTTDVHDDLPPELGRIVAGIASGELDGEMTTDALYEAMVVRHESFWTTVYPLLLKRQITCAQVRALVSRGLVAAEGRYNEVARLFNVPVPKDYKRFLNFLDHFGCKPSFKAFRGGSVGTAPPP